MFVEAAQTVFGARLPVEDVVVYYSSSSWISGALTVSPAAAYFADESEGEQGLMIPRERLLAVLDRRPVDRLPVDIWHTPEIYNVSR